MSVTVTIVVDNDESVAAELEHSVPRNGHAVVVVETVIESEAVTALAGTWRRFGTSSWGKEASIVLVVLGSIRVREEFLRVLRLVVRFFFQHL